MNDMLARNMALESPIPPPLLIPDLVSPQQSSAASLVKADEPLFCLTSSAVEKVASSFGAVSSSAQLIPLSSAQLIPSLESARDGIKKLSVTDTVGGVKKSNLDESRGGGGRVQAAIVAPVYVAKPPKTADAPTLALNACGRAGSSDKEAVVERKPVVTPKIRLTDHFRSDEDHGSASTDERPTTFRLTDFGRKPEKTDNSATAGKLQEPKKKALSNPISEKTVRNQDISEQRNFNSAAERKSWRDAAPLPINPRAEAMRSALNLDAPSFVPSFSREKPKADAPGARARTTGGKAPHHRVQTKTTGDATVNLAALFGGGGKTEIRATRTVTFAHPQILSYPQGVAVDDGSEDSTGNVYVCAMANHRVLIFDKDGKFLKVGNLLSEDFAYTREISSSKDNG